MWFSRLIDSIFSTSEQTAVRTYEQGLTAYKSGQYRDALAILKPYAAAGDPLAQLTLGNMYKQGLGVLKDVNQAALWYSKAALQGDLDAKFSLALMYIRGDSVTRDKTQALNWLKDAAEQGHRQARLAYDYITREEYQKIY